MIIFLGNLFYEQIHINDRLELIFYYLLIFPHNIFESFVNIKAIETNFEKLLGNLKFKI